MKNSTQRLSYVKLLALPVTSSLLLTACLGGSSEDPFKPGTNPPESVTAASCFDNTLNYTVGRTITLAYNNYAMQDTALQPSTAVIKVVGNTANFDGQTNLIEINEVRASNVATATDSWQSDKDSFVERIPSTGIATTVGSVSETITNASTAPVQTITTVYNPAAADQRRTMEVGKSLTQTLSGTIKVTSPATNTQAAVDTTNNFNIPQTITFVAKETQTIGTERVESCRFKISVPGQADTTEWVYRGQTIRKEVNGFLTELVTSFRTSS